MVAVIVIVSILGLLFVAAVLRLIWSTARGNMQIESTSLGRQLFGRSKDRGTD